MFAGGGVLLPQSIFLVPPALLNKYMPLEAMNAFLRILLLSHACRAIQMERSHFFSSPMHAEHFR